MVLAGDVLLSNPPSVEEVGRSKEISAAAVPFSLQIEVGNGSWESSLVQPAKQPADEDGVDRVTFDLVLVTD